MPLSLPNTTEGTDNTFFIWNTPPDQFIALQSVAATSCSQKFSKILKVYPILDKWLDLPEQMKHELSNLSLLSGLLHRENSHLKCQQVQNNFCKQVHLRGICIHLLSYTPHTLIPSSVTLMQVCFISEINTNSWNDRNNLGILDSLC